MATIAVIGTLVDDLIRHPDGTETRSLGGIAYAVGTLAALADPGVRILPVCRVADDVAERVDARWTALPNVDTGCLIAHEGRQSRVRLDYPAAPPDRGADRTEMLLDPLAPLDRDDIAPALDAEVVLVNCVSGFDLTLEAMIAAGRSPAWVYLDLHSLTLGRRPNGVRYLRRPDRIGEWLASADALQCNETEAVAALGSEVLARADPLGAVPGPRPDLWLITRGSHGLRLARRGHAARDLAAPARKAVDPTGAGDCLGAAFVAFRRPGADPTDAARRAVALANASCMLRGSDDLASLASCRGGDTVRNPPP